MLRQTQFVEPVPLTCARLSGLLDESGIVVDLTETHGSDEQLQQLLNGEQDLAVTSSDNVFIWNQRGADTRIVGQVERSTPMSFCSRRPARTLAELDGSTFAVDALDNGFSLAARYAFRQAGATVTFVQVGGVRQRMEALLDGGADATLLGPPFDVIGRERGLHVVASIDADIPGYAGQSLVAPLALIRERRDELKAYLGVLEHAVQQARNTSDEAGRSALTSIGYPAPAAAALWRERPQTMRVDIRGLRVVERVRRELGLLPLAYSDLSELYDDTLLAKEPESFRQPVEEWLGAVVVSHGEGTAVVTMTVEERHLNGSGTLHGGVLFTLADAALAHASIVAAGGATLHASIAFIAPGRPGDELIATATTTARWGANYLLDVTVRCGDVTLAEFRGQARQAPR